MDYNNLSKKFLTNIAKYIYKYYFKFTLLIIKHNFMLIIENISKYFRNIYIKKYIHKFFSIYITNNKFILYCIFNEKIYLYLYNYIYIYLTKCKINFSIKKLDFVLDELNIKIYNNIKSINFFPLIFICFTYIIIGNENNVIYLYFNKLIYHF